LKKNLVLTGMMGVGKSTIGKRLAKSLKLKFVDVDKAIEEKEKNTVSEIFNNKGESYFRKIEKKITLEVLKKSELVIALGGGAFINSSIRKEVLNSCTSIWLDLNVKSILLRLKNVNKRPLLNQNNLEKTLNKIYLDRKRIYNESNFRIKCESKNIKVIIDRIIKIYENSKN
jgi:shikimate kinase/shikimate kinase/3-dehydroquinate synthase